MTIERKQISVWISAESAALLQRLKQDRGGSIGSIIECAIAAYATSEPTSVDTSIHTSSSLDWSAAIDDLRDEMNSRVLVLESRLGALEAMGAVAIGAVEEVTVNAAMVAVGAVAEPVDITAAAKKKALSDTELDAVVRDYLKRSGNKIIPAGDLMRQDGISFSQKRLIESRDRIAAADSIKALLER